MTHRPNFERRVAAPYLLDGLRLAGFHHSNDARLQVPKNFGGARLAQWQQTLAGRELSEKRLMQISGADQVRIEPERAPHQAEGDAEVTVGVRESLL